MAAVVKGGGSGCFPLLNNALTTIQIMSLSPGSKPGSTVRGIALFVLATFGFACLDTYVKYMTRDYHPVQIAWGRYVFHLAFVMVLMTRHGGLRMFRSARPWFQIGRAIPLMIATLLFFSALTFMPIADVVATMFVGPLLVTAMAFFVLKEKVGPRRWTAIGAGFVGMLIIIRPGFGVVHWGASILIIAALSSAWYHLATRMIAGIDSAQTTLLYTGLVGTIGFSLLVPFFWRPLDAFGWTQMVFVGVLAGISHYILIHAYTHAPASTLSLYSYSSLFWVTLLGYYFFGEFPDAPTIAGALIIVLSGVYVFYREAYLRRLGKI
ncbi:MAG: DMT family transporter [Methylocystis sp.]